MSYADQLRSARIYVSESRNMRLKGHRAFSFTLLKWAANARKKARLDAYNASVERHNAAIQADRLFGTWVTRSDRCFVCGELLHPYPEPTYWMQYPLMEASKIDGNLVCDDYRKPKCLDSYLLAHPTIDKKKRASIENSNIQMELFA